MTTGFERLGALMQGQLPDRVPVCCNLLEQGARELGMSIQEYYTKGEHVAEGQIRLREKYGYDFVSAFFYTGMILTYLGCERMIYDEAGPPNVGEMILQNEKDIEDLEIPTDLGALPAFEEQRKAIEILRSEYGGRYPIQTAVVSSFSLPAVLMGMDRWMELLFFGSESLRNELLQKCSVFCGRLTRLLLDTGVDMVSYGNPVASVDVITEKQFHKMALPWIKADVKEMGGTERITYFNGGGRINPTINTLIEEVGFGAYYINPLDDVAEAKQIVNGRGLSSGVINDIHMITWSRAEVEEEVKRIMLAGAPGGGFVFGTLVMPMAIPEENIRAMLEAAYRYGDYAGFLNGAAS